MSHSYASNPSRTTISRGRGANRGHFRGASTAPTIPLRVGFAARPVEPNTHQQNIYSSAASAQNSQGFPLGPSRRSISSNFNSTSITRTGTTTRGRGRMDLSQNQNPGPRRNANAGPGLPNQEEQNEGTGRENTGGFTVIPRNEEKWRKINQQAQRETANYERFKEAQKKKTYSYVGTCGGGDISEDEARARQANQVRAAKFNRQMKQAEYKLAAKKAEEDAIEAKRAEARRKAEANAERQARAAPVEEVRRNREAFLARLETSRSPPQNSTQLSNRTPPHHSPQESWNSNLSQTSTVAQTSLRSLTNPKSPQTPKQTNVHRSERREQVGVERNPQTREVARASYAVKTEIKRESKEEVEFSPLDEGIQILMSVYPDLATEYLSDLLNQTGSVEQAMALLDMND